MQYNRKRGRLWFDLIDGIRKAKRLSDGAVDGATGRKKEATLAGWWCWRWWIVRDGRNATPWNLRLGTWDLRLETCALGPVPWDLWRAHLLSTPALII